jgi:hypothetical protein
MWSSPSDLGSQVSRSLVKLIKTKPAIGWVRANLVPTQSANEEILGLRRRIEELETEIDNARVSEPQGISDLSKGDDTYSLRYEFVDSPDVFNQREYSGSSNVSWDDIFGAISPHMINEAPESSIKDALDNLAGHCCREDHGNDSQLDGKDLSGFSIIQDDLHTIKIQLRALGLITQSIKSRRPNDLATYWTLTPYGDTVMTRLLAIPKTETSPNKALPDAIPG